MIDDTRVISRPLATALSSLLFAITGIILGLVEVIGERPPHYYWLVMYFIYLSGFLVVPLLMFLGTKSPKFKLLAIGWTHVFVGALLLYISEIFSPFTPLWSMLILFASIYYGWKGFIGSSLSLIGTGIFYVMYFPGDLKPNMLVYCAQAIVVVALAILASYLFVNIVMHSRKKARDLENAQRSEQMQINRLNTLLNSINDAVMTLNRYGRITSQNAAAQAFFDTNESLIGRHIDTLVKLTDKDNQPVTLQTIIAEVKTASSRDDLSTGSGDEVRHLNIQMSRIRGTFDSEEEYGIVLIIRDITKQKTLQEEKDEFISVTSHELRTPVAIAEGSLSNLLVMQERHMPEDKIKDAADEAHRQVVYLSNMINDLSTLSRAERGVGDNIETIDVTDMMHNLFNRYTPEAEAKSLKLNLDLEPSLPQIDTSRLYLEEILQNFITNSIKYTKEGSVTMGAGLADDDHIRFFVKDTGIGMSKADLDHIFEKFYRSEDYRTRETSGTGLGLYVVKKLADKLNTHIEVQSRLNSGSEFSFELSLKSKRLATLENIETNRDQKPVTAKA